MQQDYCQAVDPALADGTVIVERDSTPLVAIIEYGQ